MSTVENIASENITRAEARQRAAGISVEGYAVELDLTGTGPTFTSTTTVRFSATVPTTWIDLIADSVERVKPPNGLELALEVAEHEGHEAFRLAPLIARLIAGLQRGDGQSAR